MRTLFLAVALVSGLGTYLYAQTPVRPLSLSFVADAVTTRPAFGYDGIVRNGNADNVVEASGHVLILINDMQITTSTAVWHIGATEIEVAGGSRIELPAPPTSFGFRKRR